MNTFDEHYIIRRAHYDDIGDIMEFIGRYWKPGHIMSENRPFFEYEFCNEDRTVNFILAFARRSGQLEGIYGFLLSAEDREQRDIWGSIWKVKEGNMALLGVELWKRLDEIVAFRYHLGIGANPRTTIPIMKTILKRYVGKMKHFYIMNRSIPPESFRIARQAYLPSTGKQEGGENCHVYLVSCIEELKEKFPLQQYRERVPYKDFAYIQKRYFQHPVYEYRVLAVEKNDVIMAVVVTRDQTYNGKTAVRIVDFIGEESCFPGTGDYWEKVLQDMDVEYIDFYAYGFREELVKAAGFAVLQEDDSNIIPNYFSPYELRNIDIWTHSPVEKATYCKADGDQDRPN